VADTSTDAVTKVVDELLARLQYGERWARHWLDVARYADSNGYERDGGQPNVWRYRDYVINAFNKDMPYDRFLTEQHAGDEVADFSPESQIATMFLRLGTFDDEPADKRVDRYDQLGDVLGTEATAFMGVTLRCHDHKFEPFSQADYYRMLAVFESLKAQRDLVREYAGKLMAEVARIVPDKIKAARRASQSDRGEHAFRAPPSLCLVRGGTQTTRNPSAETR
jgi:hypothetical protein